MRDLSRGVNLVPALSRRSLAEICCQRYRRNSPWSSSLACCHRDRIGHLRPTCQHGQSSRAPDTSLCGRLAACRFEERDETGEGGSEGVTILLRKGLRSSATSRPLLLRRVVQLLALCRAVRVNGVGNLVVMLRTYRRFG